MVTNEMATEEHQKKVAEEIANKCIEEIKNHKNPKRCSKIAVNASSCVWTKFAKACPTEKQIQSNACKKARKG